MAGFEGIYTEKERAAFIRKEKTRLKKILADVPEERLKIVDRLIDNAAVQALILEESGKIIARDGTIETYQNGATQYGVKKSAAVDVHDKATNTYTKIVKQLLDLLPEASEADAAAELMEFLNR